MDGSCCEDTVHGIGHFILHIIYLNGSYIKKKNLIKALKETNELKM